MSRTSVLTDGQWARIQPLLPTSDGRRGRPFRDDRRVVEGIIYRYRCGIAWRDVPAEFGPWQTIWKRHRRYSRDGTWDRILAGLLAVADAPGEWTGRCRWTPRSTARISTRTNLHAHHRGLGRITRICCRAGRSCDRPFPRRAVDQDPRRSSTATVRPLVAAG